MKERIAIAVVALLAVVVAYVVVSVGEGVRWGEAGISAMGGLRTLTAAQDLFRERRRTDPRYASSLEELGRARLIDAALASGTRNRYAFRIVAASERAWSATATPVGGPEGARAYFVDESGVIRYSESGVATAGSAPVGGPLP